MHKTNAQIVSQAGNHSEEVSRWIKAYLAFVDADDDRGCDNRDILITPFAGARGNAGFVITIDGSPPKGVMVLLGSFDYIVLEGDPVKVKGEFDDFSDAIDLDIHLNLRDTTVDLIRKAVRTTDR